jgi:hypothetical protein
MVPGACFPLAPRQQRRSALHCFLGLSRPLRAVGPIGAPRSFYFREDALSEVNSCRLIGTTVPGPYRLGDGVREGKDSLCR